MQDRIDNQLWELQRAANKYKGVDPLADWVLFAVSRHINSGKATRHFEKAFVEYDSANFTELIKKCLNGDKSDNGIINTCKKVFSCK